MVKDMEIKHFPFPDKESSMLELERDYCFHKIDKDKVNAVFEDAWKVGEDAAEKFLNGLKQETDMSMPDILKKEGFRVQYRNEDYIVGKRRYFCEYISQKNIVIVYQKSVHLWCESNGYDDKEGLNIILCHEYFHYLEWHKIGLTSKRYLVPMLKIGQWKLGKTGISALSEIAANAFANKCFRYILYDK
jgi:hypothetical protein